MEKKTHLLDEKLDRLELTNRTRTALEHRYGKETLIREIVMMGADQLRAQLKAFHGRPGMLVNDIQDALGRIGYTLATSWTDLPPTQLRVRNPRQMTEHRPSVRR